MTFQNAVPLASYDAGGTVMNVMAVAAGTGENYEVNANADLTENHLPVACEIRVISQGGGLFSSTPLVYANTSSPGGGTESGTVAENGFVNVSERSMIEQVCFAAGKSTSSQFVSAYGGAELTAMRVTSNFNFGPASDGRPADRATPPSAGARPTNRFVNPFAGRHAMSRRHTPRSKA